MVQIDRNVGELSIHNVQTQKDTALLWSRVDSLKLWNTQHETDTVKRREDVTTEIGAVNAKIEKVINQGKGALWVFGMMFAVSQALIATSISWVFTNVNEINSSTRMQSYRIEQLEKATSNTRNNTDQSPKPLH